MKMNEAARLQVIQAGDGRTLSRWVTYMSTFYIRTLLSSVVSRHDCCLVSQLHNLCGAALCCVMACNSMSLVTHCCCFHFRAAFLSLLKNYNCFLKDQTQLHLSYSQVCYHYTLFPAHYILFSLPVSLVIAFRRLS